MVNLVAGDRTIALLSMNSVRHLMPREYRMYVVLRQIRVLVVAAAGLSGSLAMAADANHGSDLAKRWCAHLSRGQ
jgi:hypothetical protein